MCQEQERINQEQEYPIGLLLESVQVEADKKLVATVKKFGVQSLTDIDECNMFKDDNTILNFKKPTI